MVTALAIFLSNPPFRAKSQGKPARPAQISGKDTIFYQDHPLTTGAGIFFVRFPAQVYLPDHPPSPFTQSPKLPRPAATVIAFQFHAFYFPLHLLGNNVSRGTVRSDSRDPFDLLKGQIRLIESRREPLPSSPP